MMWVASAGVSIKCANLIHAIADWSFEFLGMLIIAYHITTYLITTCNLFYLILNYDVIYR